MSSCGRNMTSTWEAHQQGSSGSTTGRHDSTALGQTLHFITKIKLQELEKQRLAFEAHAKVLEEANNTTDLTQRVELLLKAVRDWSGSGGFKDPTAKQIIGGRLDLEHLDLWLRQSKKDPCFSPSIIRQWGDTLEAHIRHNLSRFKYAHLFGNLLTEWTASGDSVTGIPGVLASSTPSSPVAQEESASAGRKEMVEQMERLQGIIFEPAAIDVAAYTTYLDGLFSSDAGKAVLKSVRDHIRSASVQLQHERITADDMSWTIRSVLSSDLMNQGKRATLKEMAASSIVLEELASVLTMRLADLESWSWPADGILVDMRRAALNGKYRAFNDPDILDGLFLEYVGVKWQIAFKDAFRSVLSSSVWNPSIPFIPRKDLEYRRQFIDSSAETFRCSLESSRVLNRQNHFFLTQLTSSTARRQYDDEGDVEESGNETLKTAQIKQRLIHLMMNDCLLNTAVHKSHTVVRSDFEWFGPSLPHNSLLATLEYYGVSQPWLKFFKSFLRAPTRFRQDPTSVVRVRERGTPTLYSISQLLGEVILFGMDFAVNQRAKGIYLYRLHDDLWLWDSDQERCEAAWAEMSKFASVAGLKFNEMKTGAVRVGGELSAKLPRGDVRWGFLKFDVEQARFAIDQEGVTPHIIEFQRQLAATKSVFGWVNVFNRYMAFFQRNFGGRPPACFGQPLINDIIDTLARIQRELFPNHAGGAIGYLQSLIKTRFGVDNIPEGYFYFPINQGGLELRNPMIEAYALQTSGHASGGSEDHEDSPPAQLFVEHMEVRDRQRYRELQENWDLGRTSKTFQQDAPDEFLSFEEYVQYRETLLEHWQELWLEMLRVPDPRNITLPPVLQALQTTHSNDYYTHYVLALYGEELVQMFGSLELVDASLIPVGMVDLFKTSKLRWDQ